MAKLNEEKGITMSKRKRLAFMGIIMVSLGITINVSLKDQLGSIGIVFIGIGGFLLIAGMNIKED